MNFLPPDTKPSHQGRGYAAVIFVFALFAASASNAADADMSARKAQLHHACADVMGLNPSESPYQSCVLSLQQSLSHIDDATQVDRARHACEGRGLKPDSRDFAVCVNGMTQTSAQK
jgi:hypothetical protein